MFSIFIPTPPHEKNWNKESDSNTINSQPATHKWYTQNMFTRLSQNLSHLLAHPPTNHLFTFHHFILFCVFNMFFLCLECFRCRYGVEWVGGDMNVSGKETEWMECNRHFMYFTHFDLPTQTTSLPFTLYSLFSGLCCCRRTQQTHFHNRFDFFAWCYASAPKSFSFSSLFLAYVMKWDGFHVFWL